METQALKFFANAPETPPLRATLDLDKFERPSNECRPAAYLLKKQDLAALKKFQDLIVDRGKKHKAKSLSSLLLGQEKIPLIDGNYAVSGHCNSSIRTLLENALEKEEQNLFIIGAEEDIFNSLWEQAGHKEETPSFAAPGDGRMALSRMMLDMMDPCVIPPELSQDYIGESAEAQFVRTMIMRAAGNDYPILILGDTGTGKEIVARAIHRYSKRGSQIFMPVICGGIPADLFESELFGHEKGAYTDAASRKTGLWELAKEGTLFLDEIGDLSLHHQAKILRALEEGEFRRVGGTEEIKVHARVIAATNRNLLSMIQAGQFRDDLYYRLSGVVIRTPSLRNHPDDIPLLAQGVWREVTNDKKRTLSSETLDELKTNRWPGNVRELKRVLQLLHSLFPTDQPRVEDLRMVMIYLSHGVTPREVSSQEAGSRRIECVNHLQRAEEVLRATGKAIDPAMKTKLIKPSTPSIDDLIRSRIDELEILCLHPRRFHQKAMFFQTHDFKGKLTYFQSLLQKNGREARRYWIKEVVPDSRKVLTHISKEIKMLLGTSSLRGRAARKSA